MAAFEKLGVIQVTIRFNGNFKPLVINRKSTIVDLFSKIRNDVLRDRNNTNFFLICDGQQLTDSNYGTIESLGIVHGALLDFCQRLPGGSGRLTVLPGKISLTREPCCITYDDDLTVDRARMPCGCVISVEAMKDYCDMETAKGRCNFNCPNCNADWPFFLIRHVLSAIMSPDQLTKLSAIVNDNFFGNMPTVQQCPKCHNFCERSKPTLNRVLCTVCTSQTGKQFEFCWACLKSWKQVKATARNQCGNAGCTGKDSRIRHLLECPTKDVGRIVGVPSVRSCEGCGNLIHHREACKHMTCRCGYKFCFVCLEPMINDRWQCGSFNTVCEVAPRQTKLQKRQS